MAVPFYPTINEEQNPADTAWVTAEFSSTFRVSQTFCDGVTREEGDIELVYVSLAGVGYDELIQAIETDMAVLMAQRDDTGNLVLMNRSAPFEYSQGSAAQNYAVSVEIEYQLYNQ